MKVYICYEFEEKHGGGGTSVLENLRRFFINSNLYTDNPAMADIILFNSFHAIDQVISLKKQYPEILFVHRIDGPMGVYNSPIDLRDEFVFLLNKYIADATIFQTHWSKRACEQLGLKTKGQPVQTIINAPDSSLFKPVEYHYSKNNKLKIFYSSWSTNMNKGFDTLLWLDEHLDWSKYEFNFAGRSEYSFKNIRLLGNLSKEEIANELKSSHLFLFASKYDPCSNSLAEAIATGIPVLCYNGGGSPELLPQNAHVYNNDQELPEILKYISNHYDQYSKNVAPPQNYDQMTSEYAQFLSNSFKSVQQKKRISSYLSFILRTELFFIKLFNKFETLSKLYGVITGKYQIKRAIQLKNRKILSDE